MAYGSISVDQINNTTGYSLGAGNASLMKNRIINGAMLIDQRNAGSAFTLTTNTGGYTPDRWVSYTAGATVTTQQVSTAPTGFINSIKYTVSTGQSSLGATDINSIGQRIEGFNMTDVGFGTANAKTLTLSFWVQASITGTYGGCLKNPAGDGSYLFTYSITSANTWQYITVTISGQTSGTWTTTNAQWGSVLFSLGTGSSYTNATTGSWIAGNYYSPTGCVNLTATTGATFYLTGIQLEVGSMATGFEYRHYTHELALCQRYYAKSYAQATPPGTASTYNGALQSYVQAASGGISLPFRFPVSMRVVPTVTFYDLAGNSGKVYANGNNVTPDVQLAYYGTDGAYFGQTSVTGTGVQMLAQYAASAEL
jgi:hypothetical protein